MEGLPGHPVRRCRSGARRRTAVLTPRRLVLLRYGRTAHNADGIIQGQLDVPLDATGREQAAAAAEALAAAQPYAVVSSDLLRARDTGQLVADTAGVPLTFDVRLRELDLGRWQGLTSDQAREQFPAEYAAWRAGADVRRGGGETSAEAGARAAACVLSVALPPGRTLIAVTHGGTARATVAALLELPAEHIWRLAALGNCCWSVLVEGDRGWRLERHGAEVGTPAGRPAGGHELGGRPEAGVAARP